MKTNKPIKRSQRPSPLYNKLPKRATRAEFNRHIKPYLSVGRRGPGTKISSYKIFNHILKVLHTGRQWYNLDTGRDRVSWQAIYHSPLIVQAVNVSDTQLLPEALSGMVALADKSGVDLTGSYLTLDPGFDSAANKRLIKQSGMIPVIKPNPRNDKNRRRVGAKRGWLTRRKDIYKQRLSIERYYAWEDVYRKLVIRYETRHETFMGWRYLAAALINYRHCFGKREDKR